MNHDATCPDRPAPMSPLAIASIVFACALASAVVGMFIRLPDHHRDQDSKDTVKLVMGLIATLSALVLSLLVASANSSYNAERNELQSLAADVMALDRLLVSYGPETQEIRALLREAVAATHDRIWSPDGLKPMNLAPVAGFINRIQNLPGTTDSQRFMQGRIMQLGETLVETRLLMFEQLGNGLSGWVLAALVSWICLLFLGYGLFSRFNLTVAVALSAGALSVSGAIFLIMELNTPFSGLLQISDTPLRHALAQITR